MWGSVGFNYYDCVRRGLAQPWWMPGMWWWAAALAVVLAVGLVIVAVLRRSVGHKLELKDFDWEPDH